MSRTYAVQRLEHSPTLNTVIMVEEVLKRIPGSVITVAELKRLLPRQVNHNVLKIILIYLEQSNKIAVTMRGITWTFNPDARLRAAMAKGFEL